MMEKLLATLLDFLKGSLLRLLGRPFEAYSYSARREQQSEAEALRRRYDSAIERKEFENRLRLAASKAATAEDRWSSFRRKRADPRAKTEVSLPPIEDLPPSKDRLPRQKIVTVKCMSRKDDHA